MTWQLIHADCIDAMRELGEASVDAVVTDPPYGLEFMGKEWDRLGTPVDKRLIVEPEAAMGFQDGNGGNAFSRSRIRNGQGADPAKQQAWHAAWAAEALRVLKPGGHLLSFGGTRTYHRLVCALEDAGFEIRDCLAWLYGSGFPKSLDVSKAIDKARTEDDAPTRRVAAYLDAASKASPLSQREIEERLGLGFNSLCNFVQPNRKSFGVPRWDLWLRMKDVLAFDDSMDAEVWRLNGRKGKPGDEWLRREITGMHQEPAPAQTWNANYGLPANLAPKERRDIPTLADAERWQGWGTALKPAFEPIVLARKPLSGTVAANVLEHGTGALNVDGTRIEADPDRPRGLRLDGTRGQTRTTGLAHRPWMDDELRVEPDSPAGRWPANVLLDADAAAALDEQSGERRSAGEYVKGSVGLGEKVGPASIPIDGLTSATYADRGGPSRFYFTAKTSRAERENGVVQYLPDKEEGPPPGSKRSTPAEGRMSALGAPRRNDHPTVKPVDLMQWLCRLITPPQGVILDPFAGSGSTGIAALREGFSFIGIERESDYVEIARARIIGDAPLFNSVES